MSTVQARQSGDAISKIEALEAALSREQQDCAERLSAAKQAVVQALQVQADELDALRRLLRLTVRHSSQVGNIIYEISQLPCDYSCWS